MYMIVSINIDVITCISVYYTDLLVNINDHDIYLLLIDVSIDTMNKMINAVYTVRSMNMTTMYEYKTMS